MRILRPWPRSRSTRRRRPPGVGRTCWALALGLLLIPLPARAVSRRPAGRVLLIANESYSQTAPGWWDLDGPRNDVELLRGLLVDRLGFEPSRVEVLTDATRAQMVEAFERLIAVTEPGDRVYVHYSGHGSRVPDANGDEGDRGWDSTLVPVDARAEGSWEILDDEIALWMHRLRQKTPDVLLVVDACHSGTISRGATPVKVRQAPSRDDRSYAWSVKLRGPLQSATAFRPAEDRFVRISACLDVETAKEYPAEDGKIYGLLTWQWARALTEARSTDSYATLMQKVSARVFHLWQDLQHPRLEGARDVIALGGVGGDHPSLLAVTRVDGPRVELDGGLLQGVAPGSVYGGWPGRDAAAVLRIESVRATTSTARLLEGAALEAGDLFQERASVPVFDPLAVAVRADASSSTIVPSILRGIDGSPRLRSVARTATPDVVVTLQAKNGSISATLLDPTGTRYAARTLQPGVTALDLPGEDAAPLLTALVRIATLRDILKLARDHQSSMEGASVELLQLEPASSDHPDVVFTDTASGLRYTQKASLGELGEGRVVGSARLGDVVSFRLRNATADPLYFYLLNLDPRGLIQQAFPPPGWEDWARVAPGETKLMESAVELVTSGWLDTYVWLIVPEPTDLGFLTADALATNAIRGAGEGRLAQVLLQGMGLRTRGSAPLALRADDLATRMIYMDVQVSSDGRGEGRGDR
jgi:hypothetical protein